jgi:uncharacterized protein (TIGR03435 family)
MIRVLAVSALAAALAWSQPPARPSFEAVTVKPSKSTEPGFMLRLYPGGRLQGAHVTLKWLVTVAYHLQKHQVTGSIPGFDTERYDIEATAGRPIGDPEGELMLQSLLEDRFHLKFHRETREMRIYSLLPGKNGIAAAPNLHSSPSGDCGKMTTPDSAQTRTSEPTPCGGESVNAGKIIGHRTTLDEFAGNLAIMVDTSVTNNTGLRGSYDLSLTWSPDQARNSDDTGPSLFTALEEQLGLKLQAGRGTVDVLVVDSADKQPE